VDSGVDEDWGRKDPYVKIATPPFYAAWCPNAYHDTLIGVLINGKFQVLDFNRNIIPHLYCAGEAAAGQGMHGHGKNIASAYAIGTHIVNEPSI
ncbi:MAG: FAD-binding protein, partial [Coriobacteriia bacterium]|nr:FAD-binding protein [Coriobacteriia bacterium]